MISCMSISKTNNFRLVCYYNLGVLKWYLMCCESVTILKRNLGGILFLQIWQKFWKKRKHIERNFQNDANLSDFFVSSQTKSNVIKHSIETFVFISFCYTIKTVRIPLDEKLKIIAINNKHVWHIWNRECVVQ